MIFYSHANKTHFHKKGFALSLSLNFESGSFWNSEMAYQADLSQLCRLSREFVTHRSQLGGKVYMSSLAFLARSEKTRFFFRRLSLKYFCTWPFLRPLVRFSVKMSDFFFRPRLTAMFVPYLLETKCTKILEVNCQLVLTFLHLFGLEDAPGMSSWSWSH